MDKLQIFKNEEFGEIRTVDVDGKRGLVASDVAKALGYKDPIKAITRHCRWGVKRPIWVETGKKKDGSPAMRETEVNIIFKPDLYRLVANSELPGAEKFESWIFDEVLVSIDEFGAYMTPDKLQEVLLNPDTLITLATQLKDFQERNKLLTAKIETDAPKVIFADAVTVSKDCILVGEMAKILKQNGYDTGETRFFRWLRENGYLCKQKGKKWNAPTQYSMDLGLFEIAKVTINRPNKEPLAKETSYVTGKGQIYFVNKFKAKFKTPALALTPTQT